MNIHIRRPIEFEKCLDHTFANVVTFTRQRMSVQQLLDQRDDNELLIKHLETYCDNIGSLISKITAGTRLERQPSFIWVIDNEQIQTPCWLFEAIVPRVVLAQLYILKGKEKANENEFKEANRIFKCAEKRFTESYEYAKRWKWKVPKMNHRIVRTKWHMSQIHYVKCLQHQTFIGCGLQKETGPKVMTTLASRALASATKSLIYWNTPESVEQLKISDGLRHIFKSNAQWNDGKYGHSIHTLQTWIRDVPETFPLLKEEFEKVPFLLQERITTNNGAYFDKIEAGPDMTLEEIINIK